MNKTRAKVFAIVIALVMLLTNVNVLAYIGPESDTNFAIGGSTIPLKVELVGVSQNSHTNVYMVWTYNDYLFLAINSTHMLESVTLNGITKEVIHQDTATVFAPDVRITVDGEPIGGADPRIGISGNLNDAHWTVVEFSLAELNFTSSSDYPIIVLSDQGGGHEIDAILRVTIPQVDINITKNWIGGPMTPVTVQIYRQAGTDPVETVGNPIVLTPIGGTATYSVLDLPYTNAAGQIYEYSIDEIDSGEGYDSTDSYVLTKDLDGMVISYAFTVTNTYVGAPAIVLDKQGTYADTNGDGLHSAGDTINYTFSVENTGNVTLTNITLDDAIPGVAITGGPIASLAPGATDSTTFTGSYVITQNDINAGTFTNTATVTGVDPLGVDVTDDDSDTKKFTQVPSITIDKVVAESTFDAVGDVLHYTITVTNTGNVTLTGVTVSDPLLGTLTRTDSNPADGVMSPGEVWTLTGSYTIKQSDLDAGKVDNIATADSAQTEPVTDNATSNAVKAPALTIDKVVAESTFDAVGDVLHYTITVTNTGNVTLTGVTVSDPLLGTLTRTDANPADGVMSPGEVWTLTGSYTIKQSDLDAGKVDNIATADSAQTEPVTDTATSNAVKAPALTIDKVVAESTFDAVGDVLHYTITVTNTGNVTLTGVTVSDPLLGTLTRTDANPADGVMSPGEVWTLTGSYTIKQSDLDAGKVDNTATADSVQTEPVTDNATSNAVQSPALSIDKTADVSTYHAVGDIINYSYVVTNTGNVTLTNVSVVDDKVSASPASVATLAPGATTTFTASYTVTQTDLNTGSVTNVAYATDGNVSSPTDTVIVVALQSKALTLDKTADVTTYDAVGDVVNYSYLITNTGNVTLYGPFTVVDDKVTVTVPATASLAPGESVTGTATHTITQADLDAGSITNIATASGDGVTSNQDTITVTAVQTKALTLDKTADVITYDAVGDVVNYSYLITNSGNVTLYGPFTVADDKVTVTVPATVSLAPGASVTGTATHTITQADLDAGSITNIATASGDGVTSSQDTATVTAVQIRVLTLDKTADTSTYDAVGDVITYSYLITNSGNVTLDGPFTVADDKVTVTVPATASLAPGASVTGTASHTITQADLDAGSITNVATASGDALDSNEDTVTVTAIQSKSLTLAKSSDIDTFSEVGDVVNYSYLITNTGNVTLYGPFTVVDDKVTVTVPATASLAPGESVTGTATHIITQADLDTGLVTNIAKAYGEGIDSNMDMVTVMGEQYTAITIDKQVANLTQESPYGDMVELNEGETAIYKVTITNSGNVTLENVILTDSEAMPGVEAQIEGGATVSFDANREIDLGTMEPGDTIILFYSYETVYADIARSPIENVATVTAQVDNEETLETSDSAMIDVVAIPLGLSSIEITKQVKNATPANSVYADLANGFAGDTFNYKITVTNTGTTKLSEVILTDDTIAIGTAVLINGGPTVGAFIDIGGVPSIVIGELEAGESITYTYDYVSKAADIGEVMVNTASVRAVYKPEREGYENVPLEGEASAAFTVIGIPTTGETGTNNMLIGLGLILIGFAAYVLRRRFNRQQVEE